MCNLYRIPQAPRLALTVGLVSPALRKLVIGPRNPGIYWAPGKLVEGQWGLTPNSSPTRVATSKTTGKPLSTNNARSEEVATKYSYRDAWAKGQRCLIPADEFFEPYWGPWAEPFQKSVQWSFTRTDGQPWMLAGIYNEWHDKQTGEIVPTYSMLTLNADLHPIFRFMHRHDKKLPEDQQDRRGVVPIEASFWDQWLRGTIDDAKALIKLPDPQLITHGPENPQSTVTLPGQN